MATPDYTSEFNGSLNTDFSEKRITYQSAPLIPDSGLSAPGYRNAIDLRSLYFSRSRFVLRLISLVFSAGILGGIGSAYSAYYGTKDKRFMYNGRDLWPDELDLKPSNLFLAVGAVTTFFSVGVLIGSFWPKVRHVTKVGDTAAVVTAVVGIIMCVVGVTYFYYYKASPDIPTFWTWVCDNQKVDIPEVQFKMVCGSVRFSFAMGFAIAVTELFILANVILGWFFVVRHQNRKLVAGLS